mgnify:CR=1 FL=1
MNSEVKKQRKMGIPRVIKPEAVSSLGSSLIPLKKEQIEFVIKSINYPTRL